MDGPVHTNRIESQWALLKRAYHGTFHSMSDKHLQLYLNEVSYRPYFGVVNSAEVLRQTIDGMVGERLLYRDLVGDDG